MKKKLVTIIIGLSVALSATLLTYSSEPCYVDMNTITSYDVTETGILLYFEDGTGYYLEKGEL